MLKQFIAIIVFSIALILGMTEAHQAIQLLVSTYDDIAQLLTEVFSGGPVGNLIRSLIALLTLPVFIGLIPALAYWGIKRHWFPYFMTIVWAVWLLQAGALMMR
jgi:hypothetical protein